MNSICNAVEYWCCTMLQFLQSVNLLKFCSIQNEIYSPWLYVFFHPNFKFILFSNHGIDMCVVDLKQYATNSYSASKNISILIWLEERENEKKHTHTHTSNCILNAIRLSHRLCQLVGWNNRSEYQINTFHMHHSENSLENIFTGKIRWFTFFFIIPLNWFIPEYLRLLWTDIVPFLTIFFCGALFFLLPLNPFLLKVFGTELKWKKEQVLHKLC